MRPARSIILDEGEQWLFRVIIVVSLYFAARGHNAPGGGFIGGLIAGAAFALRNLAGARGEREVCGRVRPRVLAGLGALVVVGTAIAPLLTGGALLEAAVWKGELPVLGSFKLVSAAIFDAGVYLIVVGVVLTVILALDGTGEDEA